MNDENGKAQAEQLSQELADAINNRDFEAIGSLMGENAVIMWPGAEIISGKVAVIAFWRRARQIQGFELSPQTVRALGPDALSDVGALQMARNDATGQRTTVAGKYHAIWQRAGGGWKLETLIWNRTGGGQRRQQRGQRPQGGPFRRNQPGRPAAFVPRTD